MSHESEPSPPPAASISKLRLRNYNMMRSGIYTFYNILFGFPGEQPEDYREMLSIIPAISHFIPPQTVVPVLSTRYAPLHEKADQFGATEPSRAHWRYELLFSEEYRRETQLNHADWVYYFDSPFRDVGWEVRSMHDALQHQVIRWGQRFSHDPPTLSFSHEPSGELVIRDSRFGLEREDTFSQMHGKIVSLTRGRVWKRQRLLAECIANGGVDRISVDSALNDLLDARILVTENSDITLVAFHEGVDSVVDVKKLLDTHMLSEANGEHRLVPPAQWPPRPPVCVSSSPVLGETLPQHHFTAE